MSDWEGITDFTTAVMEESGSSIKCSKSSALLTLSNCQSSEWQASLSLSEIYVQPKEVLTYMLEKVLTRLGKKQQQASFSTIVNKSCFNFMLSSSSKNSPPKSLTSIMCPSYSYLEVTLTVPLSLLADCELLVGSAPLGAFAMLATHHVSPSIWLMKWINYRPRIMDPQGQWRKMKKSIICPNSKLLSYSGVYLLALVQQDTF